MVLLHYKKNDHNQFLYQRLGTTIIGQIVNELVTLNNMRIQLDIFACAIEDLATHGPLKPDEIRGLTDQQLIDNALIISSEERKKWAHKRQPEGDQRFNEDKTHYRIGIIKNAHITNMMIQTSNKAKKMVSYKNVDNKVLLELKDLIQVKEQLKACLFIAYPNLQGLGEWEPASCIAKGNYDFTDINTDQIDYLDPKDSTLWWAGKQLAKQKPLNSYTGKNEKTKIIVKITKSGNGAPMRQPGVDEETKLKLMSMYHKKQEELKKIQSNNEDDYSNSQWANPNNLKKYLVGGGQDIKWKSGK